MPITSSDIAKLKGNPLRYSLIDGATWAQLQAWGAVHGVKTGRRSMDVVRHELKEKAREIETRVEEDAWAHYPPGWVKGFPRKRTEWGALYVNSQLPKVDIFRDDGQFILSIPAITPNGSPSECQLLARRIVDMMNGDDLCQPSTSDVSARSGPKDIQRSRPTRSVPA